MNNIYIEKSEEYLRIVNLGSKGNIELCFMQRHDPSPKIGNIFLGTIENVSDRTKGYFIDIGLSRNTYMPKEKAHKRLKMGEYVLVEVIKEEIGQKGAVVTSKISIGGNFLVISRGSGRSLFSKKIRDKNFKENYKDMFKNNYIDLIFRGASEKATSDEISAEYEHLNKIYDSILNKEQFSTKRGLVYESHGALKECMSTLQLDKEFKYIVNDREIEEYIKSYISRLGERFRSNFTVSFENNSSLFEKYGLEEKIFDFRCKKIDLKLGGNIIIDRKEALTIIDINSGSENNLNNNIRNSDINYECAKIIPNLIISRNLSGIIIIDFINMKSSDQNQKLINEIKHGFRNDRNKVEIHDLDKLGLLHLTRERRGRCIYEYLDEIYFDKFTEVNRIKFSYIKFYIKNKVRFLEIQKNMSVTLEIPQIYQQDIDSDIEDFLLSVNLNFYKVNIIYKEKIDRIRILKNII